MSIAFHSEQTDFQATNTIELGTFFSDMLQQEEAQAGEIQFIFCLDAYLLKINKEYLQHDNLTDIITFPYSYDPVSCDIFISLDRVQENAVAYDQGFHRELLRVMLHGLLHMVGYSDKSEQEQRIMHSREDYWLSQAEKRELIKLPS